MGKMIALAAGLLCSAALLAGEAGAQAFPSKTIRIIVPFAPGGTSDVLARTFAPRLQESLGQTVVVENRPGASGNIGADIVAKSAPDGYTLVLMDVGNLVISPSINPKMPFDIIKDFAPVTIIAYSPHMLVVNAALPFSTTRELIAYAKANPGKLNYATTGQGSAPHLAGVLFAQGTGVTWEDIPGKGGADSILHVISGQADLLFNGMVATQPHVKSGKLKLLAMSSEKRLKSLPDTPTVAESAGLPGFVTGSYQGVLVAAGTPKPIVARLQAEFAKIAAMPEVAERLNALGAEAMLNSPEAFAEWMKVESAKWAVVVKKANLKLE
jgi:tripartite-type tricarboxylate transporter receptor subunit TctC